MKISTALDLLMDKGLLSEEDTFTIVRDNEAGSVSLQLKHPLIVLFSNAQNLKSFSARLERLYTKDSSVLAIDPIGTILRLPITQWILILFSSSTAGRPGRSRFILFH